ncbi:hypothetical protein ACFL09_02930, partial [Planctomycetota bacterium]
AEGVAGACEVLTDEGYRESRAGSHALAFSRFQGVLAFMREGETAARAYVGIGCVHARLRQRDLAEPAFRKALSLGASTREARRCYHFLITAGLGSRDYEQAWRDAQALVALPTDGAAKATDEALLGMVLEKTQGPMKAAALYRRILEKYPKDYCATARQRLDVILARLEEAVLSPLPGRP